MRQIYLDYNATTPVAPAVHEAMQPFLEKHFGNPSSTHAPGLAAQAAIEDARNQVADLLGTDTDEIVFTGGGTEANNLAIQGIFFRNAPPLEGHLVITTQEHPATAEPARFLERWGISVTEVPCNDQGWIDPERVASALRPDTRLVSVIHANNEIGVVQSIRDIAEVCRNRNVPIHADCAQAIGKIRTYVEELGVDLLSVAGHKLYAPKGVGALYVRRGIQLEPVFHGASHERGMRPGTENTPYLVGLGRAADLCRTALDEAADGMASLRDRLQERLTQGIPELSVNAGKVTRLPNTLSVNFPKVNGAELLRETPQVCASTGSACHSGATSLSATLAAIGLDPETARGTVRLSVGWFTTEDEVDQAADLLIDSWERLIA